MRQSKYGEFKRQLDVLSSEERIDELKELLQNFITENGTCSDLERLKKNLRILREGLNERAERRLFGLSEFDEYADKETRERVLARNAFEKKILDDVVNAMLIGSKLPAFDGATHQIRKSLDIPHRYAELPAIIIKSTVRTLYTCLLICLVLFSSSYLFGDWSRISIGGYFEHLYAMARLFLFEGSPLVFYVAIVIASTWWWRFFKSYRDKEASRERQ